MATVAQLSKRVSELAATVDGLQQSHKAELEKLTAERDAYQKLYQEMLERFRKLERGQFGQKTERFTPSESQLSLSMLGMMLTNDAGQPAEDAPAALPPQQIEAHERKRPTGRKPFPDHLPRIDIMLVPREVQLEGLDAFEKIGEEVSETLELTPETSFVVRMIRPKFVRKGRKRNAETKVYIARTTPSPIPRGIAGPGLLADSIVKRWDDHLPLNRLEKIYARSGVDIARSTICGWHIELSKLCKPLVDAMRRDALRQPYICTDATGVLVQAKERCRNGHFWVLVSPGKHVLFEFTKKHDSAAVDKILAGYDGYIVADAHAVYDHLYRNGPATEVNCWAHCRRYFFKSLSTDPPRSQIALELIGALFRVERGLAEQNRKSREKSRQRLSAPLVDRFFKWCEEERESVLDDTPIAKALAYALNQRKGLSRFLRDGRLPIHNNMSELQLRRQAVGRKNWLFVGSEDGAEANATFVSLLASCQMHKIEPWGYLRDILCLLPVWKANELLKLSPLHWESTSARKDVSGILAINARRSLSASEATHSQKALELYESINAD